VPETFTVLSVSRQFAEGVAPAKYRLYHSKLGSEKLYQMIITIAIN